MRRRDAFTRVVLAACAATVVGSIRADDAGTLWERRRARMVREQIEARGIRDPAVLDAMRSVRREYFVPEESRGYADADSALPIGYDQTISQPYIVAFMTELLALEKGHRVLEIGTGSGYQTAVLATLSDDVFSLEIVPALAERARQTLLRLGYQRAQIKQGDGYDGWAEHAPYDRIIVTAAPPELPAALLEQLAPNGRLVAPVGKTSETQHLVLVTKDARGRLRRERRLAVRFVPMVEGSKRN